MHRLLAAFPVLPLGTDVRVTAGPQAGMTGIVCAIPPGVEEQPVIRLFLDPVGRPLDHAIEVSLAESPQTVIELVDEAVPDLPTRAPARAR